jgi:uncharacterized protein YdeI (YjbR/CyaY-like superfamily)
MARRIDNRARPHICKHVGNTCKKTFILKRDLTRHQRDHKPEKTVYCTKCTYSNSRTDAVNKHIERRHGGVSNGRVRKQSKQKPVNIKTLVLTFQNDSLNKQEIGITKPNTEDKNQNVGRFNCEEVYSLKENVEIIKRVNIKLKQELCLKNNLLEEKNRSIITMKTAHSALNENFNMVSGYLKDSEGMLKDKTNELAMSIKIRLDLKNKMREDRKLMGESISKIDEKIALVKKELFQDILTENIFKAGAVRDIGSPIMSVSTEGFESYINQIFIRLCDKYFNCLNDIV